MFFRIHTRIISDLPKTIATFEYIEFNCISSFTNESYNYICFPFVSNLLFPLEEFLFTDSVVIIDSFRVVFFFFSFVWKTPFFLFSFEGQICQVEYSFLFWQLFSFFALNISYHSCLVFKPAEKSAYSSVRFHLHVSICFSLL